MKIDDLFGKTVGVISGWSYGDEFDKAVNDGHIKVDATTDDRTNIKKLGLGRIDAVLAIIESGDAAINAEQLGTRIKRAATLLTINKVYIAFNKSAKKTSLLAQFDSTIAAMKKDGSFNALVTKAF